MQKTTCCIPSNTKQKRGRDVSKFLYRSAAPVWMTLDTQGWITSLMKHHLLPNHKIKY